MPENQEYLADHHLIYITPASEPNEHKQNQPKQASTPSRKRNLSKAHESLLPLAQNDK